MMKTCWTCHQEKVLALFTKDKSKRDGYSGRCAECSRIANRAANIDRIKARARVKRYRDAHPEWEAARRLADRDASRARVRKWTEENKERDSIRRKEYRKINRLKIRERINAWGKATGRQASYMAAYKASKPHSKNPV